MSDTLCFFESGVAFSQVARQRLPLVFSAFAFRDIGHDSDVLAIAGAIKSRMRNHMHMFNDTVGHYKSMLVIQIHSIFRGETLEKPQTLSIIGVNSIEYQIKREICFSRKA